MAGLPNEHTNGDDGVKFSPNDLGMYTIVSNIAEGTFGQVKNLRLLAEAIHKVTGHRVAMKFLSRAVIATEGNKLRVRREFEYTRMLRHPHIIKLYEVITTPEDIVFVLEYAEGELFDYIARHGRLEEDTARRFFQQIMAGVEYAHRQNIAHRDLKPENILLDEYLNVKIGDFGLSSETRDGEFLKTSCGSPNYAAPEVIRGDQYAGPDADVWSSGIILYTLLCNKLPFEDEDMPTLFEKIKSVKYQVPRDISPNAQNLIKSMLVLDPSKRITVAEIMRHPWFTVKLPRYLTPLPPIPGAVVGTLSSLVSAPAVPLARDNEFVEGLGLIDLEVVDELAQLLDGVDSEEVLHSLRRNDGIRGNQVKVAYMLLQDKRRVGKDLAISAEQERDDELARLDPRNVISPNAVSPNGGDLEDNPFEVEFEEDVNDDEDDDPHLPSNVSILGTSLPPLDMTPTGRANRPRTKKGARWHIGIRSSSEPMRVLSEIYGLLREMGMEWAERKDLSNIYCIEARARVKEVVIVMTINMYQARLNTEFYWIDFTRKQSYLASTVPGAGKFDRAPREGSENESISPGSYARSMLPDGSHVHDAVASPFMFFDLATQLILRLAFGHAID
ncbi:unnamed protein product [Mycena citricolor]|uniref:non-specific serine/threonine protein kinase n=1 Tax=Mycena citricolor TaxID=2018698 RepID=A0AAD2K290_9AGAR|nr:unnamed protein product [Mycena citricolor]